jgi:hypothetical protein
MLRIILGIIAGFVAWSIIWIGSDALMASFSSGWWGAQKSAMELAVYNNESYRTDTLITVLDLVRSVVASIMAGYLAAVVAGENRRSPFILGFILLIVGIAVQWHLWNVYPVWFHPVFWILLIPATILGGKMKQSA